MLQCTFTIVSPNKCFNNDLIFRVVHSQEDIEKFRAEMLRKQEAAKAGEEGAGDEGQAAITAKGEEGKEGAAAAKGDIPAEMAEPEPLD